MLSTDKFNELCREQQRTVDELADHLARGGFEKQKAVVAVKNWQKGLFKPKPSAEDIRDRVIRRGKRFSRLVLILSLCSHIGEEGSISHPINNGSKRSGCDGCLEIHEKARCDHDR